MKVHTEVIDLVHMEKVDLIINVFVVAVTLTKATSVATKSHACDKKATKDHTCN